MKCFDEKSFEVFDVEGLDARMIEIRARIQPIFSDIMTEVSKRLTAYTGEESFVHIAQHRRRSRYAPESTWSAISDNKRGYKSQAHLQLGIWQDYVFMYLSIIDNPLPKKTYATYLASHRDFPDDFVYSVDHTKPDYFSVNGGLDGAIDRLYHIKKGELEIGRVMPRNAKIWQENPTSYIIETFETLFPLYQQLTQLTD